MPLPPSSPCQRGEKVLTGLVGRGILSSRSPWMHEQEADAHGVRLIYSLFDFDARGWGDEQLEAVLNAAQMLGFAGVNVTYPFKQAVIPLLDELSEGARRVGAVNTVSFAGGRKMGYNTDVTGFGQSVKEGLAGASMGSVVQMGCGGAGSATAHALLELGVNRLTLFDSDAARCATLIAQLTQSFGAGRAVAGDDLAAGLSTSDGIVNATPMGMKAFPGLPVPAELINHRHWVADIVYFPLETALLREAGLKGCRTLNGSGMAMHQAASAFEIFTGIEANRERMHRSFLDFMGSTSPLAA